MKTVIVLALMLILSFAKDITVVKIYSSISIPNYKYPWQSGKLYNIRGSGIAINNSEILTSAHLVSNAKFIQFSKNNSSKKYFAKLKYISHQADLALLKVEDNNIFKNIKDVKFTDKITIGESLRVLGYPIGGKTLSTTKGIISRIEFTSYIWSNTEMLSIQVDVPVNRGNSGGVALNKNNEVVGLVMQTLKNTDNIAYIVPSIIIDTFLKDIKDKRVDGYDDALSSVQHLENKTLREFYNLKEDRGVIVTKIDKKEKDLKTGDIILSIDSNDIMSDATIKTPYGYIDYRYALHIKPARQKVKMKIIRDKKIMDIEYTLKRKTTIIKYERDKKPRYLIYGGFVFAPLTNNYLYTLKMASTCFDLIFYDNPKTEYIKEGVILQYERFPLKVNSGYTPKGEIVKSINGIKITDFNQFIKVIDKINTPLTVIEFVDDLKKIILDTKEAKKSFKSIEKTYEIAKDRRI